MNRKIYLSGTFNRFSWCLIFISIGTFDLFINKRVEAGWNFKSEKKNALPLVYRSLSYIQTEIKKIKLAYPQLVYIEKIGSSTTLNQPIWAVRVSDNATQREDEPKILFMGVHHAREPIGANICLELIKRLCQNYGKDDKITNWLNAIEIWFVPVVNPD